MHRVVRLNEVERALIVSSDDLSLIGSELVVTVSISDHRALVEKSGDFKLNIFFLPSD